jgi:Tfp pilus assembly protein PilF
MPFFRVRKDGLYPHRGAMSARVGQHLLKHRDRGPAGDRSTFHTRAIPGFIADTIDHDPAAAKKFYSEALTRKWSANSETAVLNYSAILATEGNLQEARRVMEDALPKMGGNAGLLHNLAVVCKQAGETEASQNYFTRYKSLAAEKAE